MSDSISTAVKGDFAPWLAFRPPTEKPEAPSFIGKMEGGKTTAPGEVRGTSIEGGEKQKIAAGDIMHIPPKTPHQVVLAPGTEITYYTLKVKEQ